MSCKTAHIESSAYLQPLDMLLKIAAWTSCLDGLAEFDGGIRGSSSRGQPSERNIFNLGPFQRPLCCRPSFRGYSYEM